MVREALARRPVVVVCLLSTLVLAGVRPGFAMGAPAVRMLAGQTPAVVAHGSAQLVGVHPPSSTLAFNVDLPVRESAALNTLIEQASTPGSSRYGDYLTQAQYASRFAPTAAQVAAVKAWLEGEGLRVTGVARDNLFVSARASTVSVERAFGVAIDDYRQASREFFANDRDPSVPADVPISGVDGLSDAVVVEPLTSCLALKEVVEESKCGLTGADFRDIYDISGSGEGQTIGFTLWGNLEGTREALKQSDYTAYAASTGTTALAIGGSGNNGLDFVQVGGAAKKGGENESALEIALDTQTAHGIAPGVHETYWLGANNEFSTLEAVVDDAANSTVAVISNSWGASEAECSGAIAKEYPGFEAAFQHGAATGKTFYFASGDGGAARGCNYPAISPYVVAVGGTGLTATAGYADKSETAIEDGGGCSNAVARPSWQTGIGSPLTWPSTACGGRAIPDVAADSDFGGRGSKEAWFEPKEGIADTGSYVNLSIEGSDKGGGAGGTSLAAPIWAAASVLWNAHNATEDRPGVGFSAPLIYALANDPNTYSRDFHDVTTGSNGFPAQTGWDEATGWGSFVFNNISNNPADLDYTGPTTAYEGQSVTLSADLYDHGTTNGLAGRTIRFTAGAESCEASTAASGAASCSVQIKDSPGKYSVTAAFAGDAAYDPATTAEPFTVTGPAFTIETLQELEGSKTGFTAAKLSGALVGQTVDYKVVVKDTGNVALKFTQLTDGACEGISPSIEETLAAGGEQVYTCSHKLVGVGVYSNEASIEGSEGTGTKTSNKVEVEVPAKPSFTIETLQELEGSKAGFTAAKLSGALIGQTVDYKVVVKNTGNVALKFTQLSDATCQGISPSAEETVPAGGEETYSCSHKLTAEGVYSNEASIEGNEGAGAKISNKVEVEVPAKPSFTIETLQELEGSKAGFTAAKLSGALVGQTVDYKVVVKNTGNVALKFTQLSDATCQGISPSAEETVPAGGEETYSCSHKLTAVGVYSDEASIEGSEGAGIRTSNRVEVEVPAKPSFTIEELQELGLGFTKLPLTGAGGETVNYEIIVKNTGNASLNLKELSDGGCENIAPNAEETVPTGGEQTYACSHTLNAVGVYSNEASIEGNEGTGTKTSNKVEVRVLPPPSVATGAALAVTQTTATLTGGVNPNGVAVTSCLVEYGRTTSYGKSMQCSPAPGSGEAAVGVSAVVTGLEADTEYHYAVVATGAGGTAKGLDATFQTLPDAPTVTTGAAAAVSQTTATLAGSVNPNGGSVTSCVVEYGASLPSATSVACSPAPGSGTGAVSVTGAATGLSANTTYEYRVVASSAGGTSAGSTQSFETAGPPEFGRCVEVAVRAGKYSNSKCTALGGSRHYEWHPGVVKAGFKTKLASGSVTIATAVPTSSVTCKHESGGGQYTGPRTVGALTVTLTGCEHASKECSSSGAEAGEVVSQTLEGVLGVEKRGASIAANKIGLKLYPAGGTASVMGFNCGTTNISVKGSLIVPIGADKMSLTRAFKAKASKGKQSPERFVSGPTDILEESLNSGAFEDTGLTAALTLTNEEPIEINTVN